MTDFLALLVRPADWNADLPTRQRIFLSLAIIALTILIAGVAVWLLSRWANRRGLADTSALSLHHERRARNLRRSLFTFVVFLGLYWAAEIAPLPARINDIVTGLGFVVTATAAMLLVVNLIMLLALSSVARAEGESRRHLEREYVPLLSKILGITLGVVWIVLVAKHFGRDISSLVAALGVGSLAVGLAAQQTLGNMIGGLVVLVERPFRVGDRIRLATGEVGEVLEVGVRSTRIRLADRNLLIVPNAELANSRVVNLVGQRSDLVVVVTHEADIEAALAVMLAAAMAETDVCHEPLPVVRVQAIHDWGVALQLVLDVTRAADSLAVEDRLRRKILHGLGAVKIPLARRTYLEPSKGTG